MRTRRSYPDPATTTPSGRHPVGTGAYRPAGCPLRRGLPDGSYGRPPAFWDSPSHQAPDLLLERLDSLNPTDIVALAAGFATAEASVALSTQRAMARSYAMSPDTPGVIDTLAHQLALSDAIASWEAVYDLGTETAYQARAAVMGLVATTPTLFASGARSLAVPWRAVFGA